MHTAASNLKSKARAIVATLRGWKSLWLAVFTTLTKRTNVSLWHKVAHAGAPSWDFRNRVIGGLIAPGRSVLDIGCGAQSLKQHLPPGCKYQPSDIIKSTPEVIFCDLNGGVYPDTRETFDYVVCSGVFEYVRRPNEFLTKIPTYGRTVLMSYCPLNPGDSKIKRLGNGYGWVNHFKQDELEDLFEKSGLAWKLVHTDKKVGYVIYSLTAKS